MITLPNSAGGSGTGSGGVHLEQASNVPPSALGYDKGTTLYLRHQTGGEFLATYVCTLDNGRSGNTWLFISEVSLS